MKRIVNILFAIWIVLSAYAVDYRPVHLTAPVLQRSGLTSHNEVVSQRSGLTSNSLSGLTSHNEVVSQRSGLTSNPSSISAANFEALNSEGGACYQPAYAPGVRKGRPGDDEGGGGGAIGEYDFHSPVGNIPWILFVLLAAGYVVLMKRRKIQQS